MKKEILQIARSISFAIQFQWIHSRVYIVLLLLWIPIQVLLSTLSIYLPGFAIEVVEHSLVSSVVLNRGVICGVALIVLKSIERIVIESIEVQRNKLREVTINKRTQKILSTDYENLEHNDFRFLMQRALESTWNMGNGSAIDGITKDIAIMITNILRYVLFGLMLAFVDTSIIVILTIAPVIHYVLSIRAQNIEQDARETITKIDRKLWYLGEKSGRPSFAKDVRIYGLKDWLVGLYQTYITEKRQLNSQFVRSNMIVDIVDGLLILLRDGLAYYILFRKVQQAEMTTSEFVVYLTAMSSFASWIGEIITNYISIRGKHLYISDLMAFLSYEDTYKCIGSVQPILDHAAHIELKNLCYRYLGANKDTLNNISIDIHAGEKIALVGLNGAGKTTLIKLICGLYHTDRGEIIINGHTVNEYAPGDYYSMFSPVFQDHHILPMSIETNITCTYEGKENRERLSVSLMRAGLNQVVKSLKYGVKTQLNRQLYEDAVDLSGGEKQKLALARALYKDAPILILDEPTAALDPLAEERLYREYATICRDKTAIFISHRLASTKFCDRIIMLEEGSIVENGTHDELLKHGGKYATLFYAQSKSYEESEDSDNETVQA